jgi:HNH endonuclease
VATPAQRRALAARDGGCLFPGCDTPPIWCEPHHWLIHWLDGGPTDLDNLALLCRRHHRFVHEGGWRMTQDHHGGFTFTPPARAPAPARAA